MLVETSDFLGMRKEDDVLLDKAYIGAYSTRKISSKPFKPKMRVKKELSSTNFPAQEMEEEIPVKLLSEEYQSIANDIKARRELLNSSHRMPISRSNGLSINADLDFVPQCTFSPNKKTTQMLSTTSTGPIPKDVLRESLSSPKSVKKLIGKAITMEEYLKNLSEKYKEVKNKKKRMERQMSVQGEAFAQTSNKLSIAREEIQEIKANLLLKERELQSLRKEREEFVNYRKRQSKYMRGGSSSRGFSSSTRTTSDEVLNLRNELDQKKKELKNQIKENQYQKRELENRDNMISKCKKDLEDLEFKKDEMVNKLEFKLAETIRKQKEIREEQRTCHQLMKYKTKCILELNKELEKKKETDTLLLQSSQENASLQKELRRLKREFRSLSPVINLNQSVISNSEDSGKFRKENEMLENENMFLKRSLESKRKRLVQYSKSMESMKKKVRLLERKNENMRKCSKEMGMKEVFMKKVRKEARKSRMSRK